MPNRCQPQVGFWVTTGSTTVVTGDEEEHHRMTLKTNSSQDSSVVAEVDPRKCWRGVAGEKCGGLGGGVGESVYGVCERQVARGALGHPTRSTHSTLQLPFFFLHNAAHSFPSIKGPFALSCLCWVKLVSHHSHLWQMTLLNTVKYVKCLSLLFLVAHVTLLGL